MIDKDKNKKGGMEMIYLMRKYLSRRMMLICSLLMFVGTGIGITTLFMQTGIVAHAAKEKAEFTTEYAKPGVPLEVRLKEAPQGEAEYQYIWKVNGVEIDNNQNTYIPSERDLESYIEAKIIVRSNGKEDSGEAKIYCSLLPVIYITTETDIQGKENYVKGSMTLKRNQEQVEKGSATYDKPIEIKWRGNTTMGYAKKPYKVKLDKKTDMFGFGENKHWVLLANYLDGSLMRNRLSYNLSGNLGLPYMQSEDVVLIFNGDYKGVYQFCEQIRVDKNNRVSIYDWEKLGEDNAGVIAKKAGLNKEDKAALETYMAEKLSWITTRSVDFKGTTYNLDDFQEISIPKITGGLLLELDSYRDEFIMDTSLRKQPIKFNSPEFASTNQEMIDFTQNYLTQFEQVISSYDFSSGENNEKVNYAELFDMDSLVKFWLVNEFFMNEDAMKKSTYLYKDLDGPFHMGPIWDMDWSSSTDISNTKNPEVWQTLFFSAERQEAQWYKYIIKDPYFVIRAQELYQQVRESELGNMVNEGGLLDTNRNYLLSAAYKNTALWQNHGGFPGGGYDKQFNTLKNFLTKRLSWMDERFQSLETLLISLGSNRLSGSIRISLDTSKRGTNTVQISVPEKITNVSVSVNGKFISEPVLQKGKAEVTFDDSVLSHDSNQENVIIVYGTEDGNNATFNYEKFIKTPEYNVAVSATDGGTAAILLDGSEVSQAVIQEGSQVTIKAAANSSYLFDGWYDGEALITVDEEYTFTVSADTALTARFIKKTYEISVTAGEGGTALILDGNENTTETIVEDGDTVIVKAIPGDRYVFEGWYQGDEKISADVQYTFSPDSDTQLSARFLIKTYKITVSANEGGTAAILIGNGNTTQATVKDGEKVTVRAAVTSGYEFEGWYEGSTKVSSDLTYSFTAQKERILQGRFKKLPVVPKPVVSAPSSFKATGKSISSIKLTWGKANNATSYKVYRASKKTGTYHFISEVKTTEYTDKKLKHKTAYYYKVEAVNANSSKYSSITSAKTKSLSAPEVKLNSQKTRQVKVTWKKITGAKKYVIYRSDKIKGTYKKLGVTTKNTYTDKKKLTSKKKYYYKVLAYGAKTSDGTTSKARPIKVK